MNRRSFLRKLGIGAAVVPVAAMLPSVVSDPRDETFIANGQSEPSVNIPSVWTSTWHGTITIDQHQYKYSSDGGVTGADGSVTA